MPLGSEEMRRRARDQGARSVHGMLTRAKHRQQQHPRPGVEGAGEERVGAGKQKMKRQMLAQCGSGAGGEEEEEEEVHEMARRAQKLGWGPFALLSKREMEGEYPEYDFFVYPFVTTAYRVPYGSMRTCLSSCFRIHNETVNIWVHLLGALILFGVAVWSAFSQDFDSPYAIGPTCPGVARALFVWFALTGAWLFGASTTFHVFASHSPDVCKGLQCVDWLSICLMIVVANFLAAYCDLNEFPALQWVTNAVNVLLGVTVMYITRKSLHHHHEMHDPVLVHKHKTVLAKDASEDDEFGKSILHAHWFRSLVCVTYAFGLFFIWVVRFTALGGHATDGMWATLGYQVTFYLCFGTSLFCVWDFPEVVCRPGLLDIVGYSHQWLHVGSVCGGLVLWYCYASRYMLAAAA